MELGGMLFFGFVLFAFGAMYNSLVRKRNEVENAVGAVHTFLQNRSDLIPSLVATVQQFAKHETKILTEVTEARAGIQKRIEGDQDLPGADQMLSQMVGRVFAVAENYPELKSNQNFLHLQSSLHEIEGQLSAARRTYNAAVTSYNSAVETLPTNLLAAASGFKRKPVFQVSAEVAAKPDIAKLFGQTGS